MALQLQPAATRLESLKQSSLRPLPGFQSRDSWGYSGLPWQRKLSQLRGIRQGRRDRLEREIVQQRLRKNQAAEEKAALDAVEKPPKEPDYAVQQQGVVNVQDGVVTRAITRMANTRRR